MKKSLKNLYKVALFNIKQRNKMISLSIDNWDISIDRVFGNSYLIDDDNANKIKNPIIFRITNHNQNEGLVLRLLLYRVDKEIIFHQFAAAGQIFWDIDITCYHLIEDDIYKTFDNALKYFLKLAKKYNSQFILSPKKFKVLINQCVLRLI